MDIITPHRNGITQRAIATKLGVSRNTVRELEPKLFRTAECLSLTPAGVESAVG